MIRMLSLLMLYAALAAAAPTAYAEPCAHAPRPRLRAGMAAVVAEGVDSLNLRALPAVATGVEVQLFMGAPLTVIDGPSCNGNYNWWRVELENGRRGWLAEGTWLRYYIVPADEYDRGLDPFAYTCPPRRPGFCPTP